MLSHGRNSCQVAWLQTTQDPRDACADIFAITRQWVMREIGIPRNVYGSDAAIQPSTFLSRLCSVRQGGELVSVTDLVSLVFEVRLRQLLATILTHECAFVHVHDIFALARSVRAYSWHFPPPFATKIPFTGDDDNSKLILILCILLSHMQKSL